MNSNTFKKGKYYLDSRDGELVEVLEDGRLRVIVSRTGPYKAKIHQVGATIASGRNYGDNWVECPKLKRILLVGAE